MGLDMYLYAKDYVSGVEYTRNAEGGYDRWDNTDFDTAISAIGLNRSNIRSESPSVILTVLVAQWRKASEIHNWFVENVQGGEDNCKEYRVSREDLSNLRQACREVLDMRDRDGDNAKPEDILPTVPGFFFGGLEYDEFYYEDVQYTYQTIDELLSDEDFKDMEFSYRSSW